MGRGIVSVRWRHLAISLATSSPPCVRCLSLSTLYIFFYIFGFFRGSSPTMLLLFLPPSMGNFGAIPHPKPGSNAFFVCWKVILQAIGSTLLASFTQTKALDHHKGNRNTRKATWMRKATSIMNGDEGGYLVSQVWDGLLAKPTGEQTQH